jgi:hypothetical protein
MGIFSWYGSFVGLLSLAVQLFFAVHALRQGKAWWLLILFFFPVVGSLVYLFAEYLPAARAGGGIGAAGRRIARRLNPAAEVRRLEDEVALSNTVNNRLALADAYLAAGRGEDAVALVRTCLDGIHEDDPRVLGALARTAHAAGRMDEARDAMERLKRQGSMLTAAMQLLDARIAEDSGDVNGALAAYGVLARGSAGEEARCRYALLLQRLGRDAEAYVVFDEMLRHARVSSGHYRREEKEWLDIARREIKNRPPGAR